MKADGKTEAEVKAVLNTFAESYAKRDLDALMACFAPDSDVLLYGTGADEKRVGTTEIEIQAKRDWEQTETASMVLQSMSVSAAGQVAWVAADGTFDLRAEGQDMHIAVRITFVLEKRGSAWLIVHAHCSTPAASQAGGHSF
jgi:uncharacterized protein (TIGR02246 family)